MRTPLILLLCTIGLALVGNVEVSGKSKQLIVKPDPITPVSKIIRQPLPPDLRAMYPPLQPAAMADTFLLGEYDFDTGGMPDPQGWVSVDRTAQLDTFFHVADGTELDGGDKGALLPLEGLQSMWCGIAPNGGDPYCGWAVLPGYGNSWDQRFESASLVCDSLRFSYLVSWDSEPGYDQTFAQYYDDAAQSWVDLPVDGGVGYYEGEGEESESFSLGAEITNDVTRLRFRFVSDGAYSDEDGLWDTDGAVVIDSITVKRYSGGMLIGAAYEDFEGEDPGAVQTIGGMWTASVGPAFGHYAALHSGVEVLQEDPDPYCVSPNYTHMWGFFDDSAVTNFGCGGHPLQGAIPYMNDDGVYMNNEVWSPMIPYAGSGVETILEYSMYEDGPFAPLVLPVWGVRSWVGGCPGPWDWYNFLYFVDSLGWKRLAWDVSDFVDPDATHVQVSLGAVDMCGTWCGVYGTNPCHSHAPLFDDVKLYRIDNAGPTFSVSHAYLFQDNFSDDGTLDGTARADMAANVWSGGYPGIMPGDSIKVRVEHPEGLALDPHTGLGAAVYAYVSVSPPGQTGKSGPGIEAFETRSVGKRYPLVDSLLHDGSWWYQFRMDTLKTSFGSVLNHYWAFDLNDDVFTPGDEIRYFFGAQATNGVWNYWSRDYNGQGYGFTSKNVSDALESPCEFAILPKNGLTIGSNILYVDAADGRDGPAQLYFDSAFDVLGLDNRVDRYDVLSSSSHEDNSPASRVKNIQTQIVDVYQIIIWSSGSTWVPTIGDGDYLLPNDYGLLYQLLDTGMSNPGVYITGDNEAAEWVWQAGADAIALRSDFCSFNLVDYDHKNVGEVVSPLLTATGSCFEDAAGVPDELIAYGGCPYTNAFDVLAPTGSAVTQFPYPLGSGDAVISQATPNTAGSTARVVLSGFGYESIRDPGPVFPIARVEHLQHVLECLEYQDPNTGIPRNPVLVSYLNDNFPNPFNPVTTIRYGIREKAHVSLKIYNAAGQLVRTLVDEIQTPRFEGFEVKWNGVNQAGHSVASGVYFYRLVAGEYTQTKKMVLLK